MVATAPNQQQLMTLDTLRQQIWSKDPTQRRAGARGMIAETVRYVGATVIGEPEAKVWGVLTPIIGSHAILLGGVGVAKTQLIRRLGRVYDQKTVYLAPANDSMTSDWTGGGLPVPYTGDNPAKRDRIWVLSGPLQDVNFVLADEVNRNPEGTRMALIPAMQDGLLVTAGGVQIPLPAPFTVYAGVNPTDSGTNEMSEALTDRFGLVFWMGPHRTLAGEMVGGLSRPDLVARLRDTAGAPRSWRNTAHEQTSQPLLTGEDLLRLQTIVTEDVEIAESLCDVIACYHYETMDVTRHEFGYRAPIVQTALAKALALWNGRPEVGEAEVLGTYAVVYRFRWGDLSGKDVERVEAEVKRRVPIPQRVTGGNSTYSIPETWR